MDNPGAILNELEILERLYSDSLEDRLVITPIIDAKAQFQPSSFEVRLGTEFLTWRLSRIAYLDLLSIWRERNSEDGAELKRDAALELAQHIEKHVLPYDGEFVLHPHEFALGCTLEFIKLPGNLAGRLEGKSTWGRLGLQIHATAGFVDPGFQGCLTFELQNVGKVPIPLYPGLRVAQISFYRVNTTLLPYGQKTSSNYGGVGLQDSRYYVMQELRKIAALPAHKRK
jgi:dCTP deaminase